MGALARTLWRIEIPTSRFCLNHPRAQGLHPSGALARTLWQNQNTPWVILSKSLRGSGATVGDLIPGYPMRWN